MVDGEAVAGLLNVIKQISNLSLPTLVFLSLYASYKGWWVWGRQLTDLKVDYEQRLAKYEASNSKWEEMAIRATGLAEHGIGMAKKSAE